MTPVLWGRSSSVNVQKVMWILAELGMDYEQIDAGFTYGKLDTHAFSQMNPNRRIPVWQEGELVLWESHAIVRHLAARGGPVAHDALADQWMEFVTSTLQPPFISVFYQKVRLPEEHRSLEILEKQSKALNMALDTVETRLNAFDWLNGVEFSTAEIAMGPPMRRAFDMDFGKKTHPATKEWLARLQERVAFQENVMTSYEELRT